MTDHIIHLRDLLNPYVVFTASDGHPGLRARDADDILATRVPKLGDTVLCNRCKGSGCRLRLICCGRDDGYSPARQTIAELQQIREAYIDPAPDHGHDRQGIIELCPDCPTVADPLGMGINVATAKGQRGSGLGDYDDGWHDCLDAMRDVER